MRVQLTGPRKGQTVVLNGVQFVKGSGHIDDGAYLYFSRCHKVVPYGTSNDAEKAAERPGKDVPSGADLQPVDISPTKVPADGGESAVGSDAGPEGSVSLGDGHADAGLDRAEPRKDPLGQALAQLDPLDDSQWKADGSPRVDALARITGGMVTKEMVEARFTGGEREAARQGQ